MFTIKAVTDGYTSGGERLKFYAAARVLVAPAGEGEANSAPRTAPVNQPAELRVHLMDDRDVVFETLDVGLGPFHFNTVYVLNERGRTVQTILPPSTHDAISTQVVRAA